MSQKINPSIRALERCRNRKRLNARVKASDYLSSTRDFNAGFNMGWKQALKAINWRKQLQQQNQEQKIIALKSWLDHMRKSNAQYKLSVDEFNNEMKDKIDALFGASEDLKKKQTSSLNIGPEVVSVSSEALLQIPVKDRTEEQHVILTKHFGGVRAYLLSMGNFLDEDVRE